MKKLGIAIVALASAVACGSEPHQKGAFQISFDSTDSRGVVAEMYAKRHLLKESNKTPPEYAVGEYTFQAVVPESYDKAKPAGLFVWVSPTDSGAAPSQVVEALARRGIIYIGANKAGNDANVYFRFRAAIDAVYNMKKLYNIDPKKIIISGSSGGGRCASMLAITYPDVFTFGGVYCIGCNFFDDVLDEQKRKYRGFWEKRNSTLLGAAKPHYYAFLTGGKDYNKPDTMRCYEGYKKSGFKNIMYHENPALDHNTPYAEDFETAFRFLDAGLFPKQHAAFKSAEKSFKTKSYAAAATKLSSCKDVLPEAQSLWDEICELADADTAKAEEQYSTDAAKLKLKLKTIASRYGACAIKAKERLAESTPAK